ncbi:ABC transporter permease [Methylobacterium brachythecii]|nr:ABC transporter permease [Methylobacterium brachythecii]
MGVVAGRTAAILLAAGLLAPVLSLAVTAAQGNGENWPHLFAYVLPQAVWDTVLLLTGVGVVVVAVGVGTAWLVTAFDFPGRRWLDAALILPLAIPTYVVAYAYLDLLHPLGPIQGGLRTLLGVTRPRDLAFPELRSLPGCMLLLGLVLYPYVYLPTRALFLMQARSMIEAARTLGAPPARVFFRVVVPIARPAIALGASLALMEALNDVGAAEFLGVRTLTVQVYATWVNRSDLPGAAQIALAMLTGVIALLALERAGRAMRGHAGSGQRSPPMSRTRLQGGKAFGAMALGWLPVLFGFALPAGYLAEAAIRRVLASGLPPTLGREIAQTMLFAGGATLVTAVLGVFIAANPGRWLSRIAGIGYALPGTILAIGLMPPLALIDSASAHLLEATIGATAGLFGVGTAAALVAAYVIRFLTIATGATEAGFGRIPPSLTDAARMLGSGRIGALVRVQLPLAWPAILSGGLLVFVDCVKELPATLLLRPLNVETLSTHLYGEAARGTYEDGAVAALLIVLVALLPVLLLLRTSGDVARRPMAAIGHDAPDARDVMS